MSFKAAVLNRSLLVVIFGFSVSVVALAQQVSQSIYDNGKVGIGTTTVPTNAKLQVSGLIDSLDTTLGAFRVYNATTFRGGMGTSDWAGATAGAGMSFYSTGSLFFHVNSGIPSMTITSGNVGVGTTTPNGKLEVIGNHYVSYAPSSGGRLDLLPNSDGSTVIRADAYSGTPRLDIQNSGGVLIASFNNPTANVGIGTSTPGAKLEVNGSIKLSSGSGGGILFPDATTQTTAWTGVLCGGDYAESVEVSGKRSQYEPGDVIVIDPASPENFLKSSTPYATTVAGIYSTRPGAIGRRSTDADRVKSEIPMAMVGIVPTKVSGENGPINVGDLLVTSSTAGYAMKGTDRNQMLGAVVGKALGSLNRGNGVINVLVTLQ